MYLYIIFILLFRRSRHEDSGYASPPSSPASSCTSSSLPPHQDEGHFSPAERMRVNLECGVKRQAAAVHDARLAPGASVGARY